MDIDTTPPPAHHESRPGMQLELPATDEVMMEVDPDIPLMSNSLSPRDLNRSGPTTTSSVPYPLGETLSSPNHSLSMHRVALEGGSAGLRPLPVPPVVLISSSDSVAWPKFKLDQLFVEWLARPESRQWLEGLLEDTRAGKTPELGTTDHSGRTARPERSLSPGPSRSSPVTGQPVLGVPSQQAPGSPVSRLFRTHIPFGDADSSPRSPPSAPTTSISPFRPTLTTSAAADFDLGRSGSVSPVVVDQLALGGDHSSLSALKVASQERRGARSVASDSTQKESEESEGRESRMISSVILPAKNAEVPSAEGDSEIVPDSKTLDSVADGIAGMSAAADKVATKPTPLDMTVGPSISGKERSDTEGMKMARSAIKETTVSDTRSQREPEHSKPQSMLDTEAQPFAFGPQEETTPSGGVLEKRDISGDTALRSPGSAEVSETHPADRSVAGREGTPSRGRTSDVVETHGAKGLKDARQEASDIIITDDVRDTPMNESHVSAAIPPPGPRSVSAKDINMAEATASTRKRKSIPRFYFPCGRDAEARERKERQAIGEFFKAHRAQKNVTGVSRTEIAELVIDVIGLPSYFATIIFSAILELFPRNEPEPSEKLHVQKQTETTGLREETRMRDIHQAEGSSGHDNAGISASRTASRNDTGGTNSDTTMGDVNDLNADGKRANGFHSNADVHIDSTSPASDAANKCTDNSGNAAQSGNGIELITEDQFTAYYDKIASNASREGRLFSALRDPHSNRDYLIPSDFKPLLSALLMCHQGLAFLHATPEFQQRYSETVIERIYFGCTRQHNGRLTLNDIKRSRLWDTLMLVDEEEDINRERKYFSYEHFYVLYCRFWELDANHDLQIDREDLMRYGSHSLTYRIVDRIFGGYARPLDCPENPGFMSYTDFIWFCLSEEDKTSDTAIDYWFRCVDMDGDGLITMYDMEFFYKEQLHRMECFGHEPVQIRDILCQLLDMINPNVQPPVIRRRDLKRCRLAGNFFNVLFNLNKFFAIEARDPLQIRQEHATPELTDWDRFAALEYIRLSAEEEGEEDESWEDVGEAANPLMAGEAPF